MTDPKVSSGIPGTMPAYLFDDDGYLTGAVLVQESPLEPGMWLLPENATTVKPALNPDYFCHWDQERKSWDYEKKPTRPADFEGMVISHTKRTPHCEELRNLIQTIVNANCTTHKIVRGENLEWMVEKIPEKTQEELEAEKEQQVRAKRDHLLSQTDYLLSSDYPIAPESLDAVKAYRQALRNIPQQQGFPDDVDWPSLPEVKLKSE